jgi:hypothetical protein
MRPSHTIQKVAPSIPVLLPFPLDLNLPFTWMHLDLLTNENASLGLRGCTSFVCFRVIKGTVSSTDQ